jgi:hypothetical protein
MQNALREIGSDYASVIKELVESLESEFYSIQEDAIDQIRQMPLEITFRSEWESYSDWQDPSSIKPSEVCVLLTTGGPAVRVVAKWDSEEFQAYSARLEVQDWGTAWEAYYEQGFGETLAQFINVLFG